MKIKIISFCFVCLFFYNSGLAKAQFIITPLPSTQQTQYALPYPGILPDHPLYFLKVFRDQTMLMLTSDPIKKTNLDILFSDKHLVMGQLLIEKDNYDLGIETIKKGEKYLLSSVVLLRNLKNPETVPPGLLDKIKISAKKHKEVINNLLIITPEESKKNLLTDCIGITNQTIEQIAFIK